MLQFTVEIEAKKESTKNNFKIIPNPTIQKNPSVTLGKHASVYR